MKQIILILLAAFCLLGCSGYEEVADEPVNGEIIELADRGGDAYYHWMGLSLDTTPYTFQTIYYMGPEGGTLNVVAYLEKDFTSKSGNVKNYLYPTIEFDGSVSLTDFEYTCTRRSDREVVYSFKMGPLNADIPEKKAGFMATLEDRSGLSSFEAVRVQFCVIQTAEENWIY